jgi:probable metal-binding protein
MNGVLARKKMQKIVHIHDVLDFLAQSGSSFRITSFADVLHEKFGPSTLYINCSETLLDSRQVVSFLHAKNKIALRGEEFTLVNAGCGH